VTRNKNRLPPRAPGAPETLYQAGMPDDEDTAFALALDRYKRREGRPHPTCREVLAVLRSLGYRKVEPVGPLPEFARGLPPEDRREL
jgi:hypothetical protein